MCEIFANYSLFDKWILNSRQDKIKMTIKFKDKFTFNFQKIHFIWKKSAAFVVLLLNSFILRCYICTNTNDKKLTILFKTEFFINFWKYYRMVTNRFQFDYNFFVGIKKADFMRFFGTFCNIFLIAILLTFAKFYCIIILYVKFFLCI